jgi:hypothetical protein
MVFVFVAKIYQIRGEKVQAKEGEGLSPDATLVNFDNGYGTSKKSLAKANSIIELYSEEALRKDVFQLYQNCDVALEITLELWNMDDRVLRDKMHRERPMSEHKILTKREHIQKRMSTYGHMDHLRNLYQDYAMLSQNNNMIFFLSNNRISTLNIGTKNQYSR